MTDETPRKATDILISIEAKVDQLLALYRNHDMVLKTLTNKVGSLSDIINSMIDSNEADISDKMAAPFQVQDNLKLPVESSPVGIRRTARPDTYENKVPVPPVQFGEYKQEQQKPKQPAKQQEKTPPSTQPPSEKKIPISQRLVDKNSKAIFLADVEIVNVLSDAVEYKTRTNSIGKWEAKLAAGTYKVRVMKQESLSKEKFDLTQNITVDGSRPTLDLPVLIVK